MVVHDCLLWSTHWGSRQNGKKGFSSMVRNGTAMLLGKLKKMNQRHIQHYPSMRCDRRLGVGMLNFGDVDARPGEKESLGSERNGPGSRRQSKPLPAIFGKAAKCTSGSERCLFCVTNSECPGLSSRESQETCKHTYTAFKAAMFWYHVWYSVFLDSSPTCVLPVHRFSIL